MTNPAPSSNDLYTLLQSTFAEATARISASGIADARIGFVIYAGERYGHSNEVEFHITSGNYSSSVEVIGRDFWECVGEFVRRGTFTQRQKNLELGAPVIDAESESLKSESTFGLGQGF